MGNIPFAARACIVRVDPNVHELATLKTAIKMTALKIEGRTSMPASLMAMTKGELCDADAVSLVNSLVCDGMSKPTKARLTT